MVQVWNEMWGVPGGSETTVGIYTSTFYAEAATAGSALSRCFAILLMDPWSKTLATRVFFTFSRFHVLGRTVKAVSPSLMVGGPAAADPSILKEFIAQAEALKLPLDFVSWHQYGNPRQCGSGWLSVSSAANGISDRVLWIFCDRLRVRAEPF
jgi:hypothetical protein